MGGHDSIVRGSDNVLADLGFAHAEEERVKLHLAYAINTELERRELNGASAAGLLGMSLSDLTSLTKYKLTEFPVGRLMTWLTALDRDVQIVIKEVPRSRSRGKQDQRG